MIQQPPPGSAGSKEVFSPRKKKGQITFAQSSFLSSLELGSLEESNNKKVAEDVQFLYSQLQRAKKDRDVTIERCEALEMQLQATQKHFKESSTRRHLEEDAFRRQLVSVKADFDKKLVKLALKAKDREDLLVDWVSAITDHKLEEQHEHLRELLVRTAALLPPSLRELMRRNKIILHPSTGRTVKTKKSTRTKVGRNKTKPKASIASADPDALLAIINENISVLDNFNMKHFNHADNDVSDSENLIQGGYQDYLNSSNDDDEPNERDDDAPMQGMPHTNNAYSQGHHYSGLSTQARGAGGGGGNVAGDSYQINEHSPRNTSSQSRAYTANSRDIRSRGSPKSANRKRGARTRRKIRTPGGRERERARGGGEDSDSGESGTVTGSIMDHNDASDEEAPPDVLIQYEMPQQYGTLMTEEDALAEEARLDAALYQLSLSQSLSLPGPDLTAAGGFGDQQAYYNKKPVPTNSRTPRSTEVAGAAVGADYEYGYEYGYGDSGQQQQYPHQQYQQSGYGDNYALSRSSNSAAFGTGADGAGGGASAPSAVGEEEGVNEDQFVETMRNLQGLVGQRAVSGGLATDKRKMSEMSAQYTEMVRGVLDTMSELSRSLAAGEEGEGSGVDGGGSGIGKEIAAMAGMTSGGASERSPDRSAARSPSKPSSSRGRPGSPDRGGRLHSAAGEFSSAHGTQAQQHQHQHQKLGAPEAPAQTAASAVPSSIEALLVQAGVSIDAISNLSDDALYASNDYAEDGNIPGLSTAGDVAGGSSAGGGEGGGYSEADIARMIATAQSVGGGNSSADNSDVDGGPDRNAAARKGGSGRKKQEKKATAGNKKNTASVASDSESDIEVLLGGSGANAATVTGNKNKLAPGAPAGGAAGNSGGAYSPVRGSNSMMAAGARALGGGGGGSGVGGGSQVSQHSHLSQPSEPKQSNARAPSGGGGGGASSSNRSAYGDSVDYSMNFDSVAPSRSKSGAAAGSGNVSGGGSIASRSRIRAEEDSQYLKLGGDWDSHSESSQQQPVRNTAGTYSNYSSFSNNNNNNQPYAPKR